MLLVGLEEGVEEGGEVVVGGGAECIMFGVTFKKDLNPTCEPK